MDEKEPGRGGPPILLATVKKWRVRRGKGWLGCQIKELGPSSAVQVPIGFGSMITCHDLES